MSKYFDIVARIIEDVADISLDEIKMDSELIDGLDLSSLELMSIINEISKQCSVKISNKELLQMETVGDIVEFLDAQ